MKKICSLYVTNSTEKKIKYLLLSIDYWGSVHDVILIALIMEYTIFGSIFIKFDQLVKFFLSWINWTRQSKKILF